MLYNFPQDFYAFLPVDRENPDTIILLPLPIRTILSTSGAPKTDLLAFPNNTNSTHTTPATVLDPRTTVESVVLTVKLYDSLALSDTIVYVCTPNSPSCIPTILGLITEAAAVADWYDQEPLLREGLPLKYLLDPVTANMVERVELRVQGEEDAFIPIKGHEKMRDEQMFWRYFEILQKRGKGRGMVKGEVRIYV